MFQPLNIVRRDRVQALCAEGRDQMQIQDRALSRDAVRLLAVGYRVVVDESLTERFECRDLLSGLVRTMLQQMPLAILAPPQGTRLGVDWGFASFTMFTPIRQAESDVHLPAAASIGSDFHAHRRYSCGDSVRLWSRKSSRSSLRTSTRLPMRVTPGKRPRSIMA